MSIERKSIYMLASILALFAHDGQKMGSLPSIFIQNCSNMTNVGAICSQVVTRTQKLYPTSLSRAIVLLYGALTLSEKARYSL